MHTCCIRPEEFPSRESARLHANGSRDSSPQVDSPHTPASPWGQRGSAVGGKGAWGEKGGGGPSTLGYEGDRVAPTSRPAAGGGAAAGGRAGFEHLQKERRMREGMYATAGGYAGSRPVDIDAANKRLYTSLESGETSLHFTRPPSTSPILFWYPSIPLPEHFPSATSCSHTHTHIFLIAHTHTHICRSESETTLASAVAVEEPREPRCGAPQPRSRSPAKGRRPPAKWK